MAKQIYIDANGNEIEVSGTINTAEMLPVAAGSTKKAVYKAGDVVDCSNVIATGLIGYSKSSIRFVIPLSKPIVATSATISGGWTIATIAGNAFVDTSFASIGTVTTQILETGVYVEVALTNPIAAATDNTPIYVYGRSLPKITFA